MFCTLTYLRITILLFIGITTQTRRIRPKWLAKKTVWESVEGAQRKLKMPKEWPRPGRLFTKCNQLKTSELLLLAGPVGTYVFQCLDMDAEIRDNMISILTFLNMLMRKVSTPGDRATIRKGLPVAITQLELHLPLYTQTTVLHCLVYHVLDQLEASGPFHVSNMLDIERYRARCFTNTNIVRITLYYSGFWILPKGVVYSLLDCYMLYSRHHFRFQTVLKGCARSKKNAMQSILNNYLLLETSLNCRLTSEFDWTVTPAGSTTASYLLKPDSANKKDRWYHVKGKSTAEVLSDAHFKVLLDIWGKHNVEFGELLVRFKEAQRNQRGRVRQAYASCVTTLAEWVPYKDPLTHREQRWVRMTPHVQVPCACTDNFMNRLFLIYNRM